MGAFEQRDVTGSNAPRLTEAERPRIDLAALATPGLLAA